MLRVTYTPPPAASAPGPGPIPLTHHEILTLVGPFSRRERHVDLAATDRPGRRIAFRAIDHAEVPGERPALREDLALENPAPGELRLVRTLTDGAGLAATLEIAGSDAEVLLAEIERVPIERQFPVRAGIGIARSYRIEPRPSPAPERPPYWEPVLLRAQARIAGTLLTVNAKTGRGLPADIELRAERDRHLKVPQDLLAVLGWDWRPLRAFGKNWRGSVRLPKQGSARTAAAEARVSEAVAHLERTLARPPAEFHARYRGARWVVTGRRALPLTVGVGLLAASPLVGLLSLSEGSLLRMLIFHAPPIMLVGLFTLREMPVIEVPPLPRQLIAPGWIDGEAAVAAVAQTG